MNKFSINLILTLLLLCSFIACGTTKTVETDESVITWQEQYDIGLRYLTEEKYEEAILAFTAAIGIDPKKAETYEAISKAYIAIGDTDSAMKYLDEGYIVTGDAQLKAILDSLTQQTESSSKKDEEEENTIDIDATDQKDGKNVVSGNLILSNFTYTYHPETPSWSENSVGWLELRADVDGPENVCNVVLCKWKPQFTPELIQEAINSRASYFKDVMSGSESWLPYYQQIGVSSGLIGHDWEFLLIGLDENADVVAYTVEEVSISE